MNITEYAENVLKMNSEHKRSQAILSLEIGLQHQIHWTKEHKKSVRGLIEFLKSGSKNIKDLSLYQL